MNIAGVCPYETPCGWCSKWDKKCDTKMPKRYRDPVVVSGKSKDLDDIKSGNGLILTDIHSTVSSGIRKDKSND